MSLVLLLLLFFFINFIYLFIYLWLCWVFVSVRGLSPAVASGDHSSSRCAGLLLSRPLLLRSTGSRRAGSVIVAHGPSCSAACGILPDQGSNPCPLRWQADSQPLRHQGSPGFIIFNPLGVIVIVSVLQFKEMMTVLRRAYGKRGHEHGAPAPPCFVYCLAHCTHSVMSVPV